MTKRGEMVAKINTYHELITTGLLQEDALRTIIAQQVASGDMKKVPESSLAENPAVLEFAKSLDLVGGAARVVGGGKSTLSYVKEQFPEVAAAVEAGEKAAAGILEIQVDGELRRVQYQPYWRTIKEKSADTPSESAPA